MEQLLNAITTAVDDVGTLPETRAFLSDENQRHMFAEKISNDSSKADFLSIPGITGAVYDNLRNILNGERIDAANTQIVAKRGRAGGLKLTNAPVTSVPQPTVVEEEVKAVQADAEEVDVRELTLERNFYPLVQAWATEAGYTDCTITGGQLPGFKWENPDLIAVDYLVSEFTRLATFDITSFEVKLRVEPSAVWQAAHYKRFSLEVYVAFAKDDKSIREKDDGRVFDLAVELGLGVLAYDGGRFRAIQWPKREIAQDSRVHETLANFRRLDGVKGPIEKATAELNKLNNRWLSDRLHD